MKKLPFYKVIRVLLMTSLVVGGLQTVGDHSLAAELTDPPIQPKHDYPCSFWSTTTFEKDPQKFYWHKKGDNNVTSWRFTLTEKVTGDPVCSTGYRNPKGKDYDFKSCTTPRGVKLEAKLDYWLSGNVHKTDKCKFKRK